jgi:hypothetical protein
MKKIFGRAITISLLACFLTFLPALAADQTIYQTVGILKSLAQGKQGWEIVLQIGDEAASGLLSEACVFYVDGVAAPRKVFIEKGVNERVTIEYRGKADKIGVCRAYTLKVN